MDGRYKMVESLREAGFTKQQAELILKIVQDAMNASRVTATELVRCSCCIVCSLQHAHGNGG